MKLRSRQVSASNNASYPTPAVGIVKHSAEVPARMLAG
jgi:hypothetical protein